MKKYSKWYTFDKRHIWEEMVNLCDVKDCDNEAKYDIKQFPVTRCKEHKINGMVVKSKWYCVHNKDSGRCDECRKYSIFDQF